MNVGKMKIHLSDSAIPYRVSTPRQIPLRFQETARSSLQDLIDAKIIVQETDPTDWCSPLSQAGNE